MIARDGVKIQTINILMLAQQRRQALCGLDLTVIGIVAKQYDMTYASLPDIIQRRFQRSATFIEYPRCSARIGPASQRAGLAVEGCGTKAVITIDVMKMRIGDHRNGRQLVSLRDGYLAGLWRGIHWQGGS